jgi:hypothetical protein
MKFSNGFAPPALFLLICGVVVGHKDESGHGQGILNDGEGNEVKTKEELMRLWDFEVSETDLRFVCLLSLVCLRGFVSCLQLAMRCEARRCDASIMRR